MQTLLEALRPRTVSRGRKRRGAGQHVRADCWHVELLGTVCSLCHLSLRLATDEQLLRHILSVDGLTINGWLNGLFAL